MFPRNGQAALTPLVVNAVNDFGFCFSTFPKVFLPCMFEDVTADLNSVPVLYHALMFHPRLLRILAGVLAHNVILKCSRGAVGNSVANTNGLVLVVICNCSCVPPH